MKLVKYLQGNEEIEEISNAEVYLEILKKKVEKPNRKKKAQDGIEGAPVQEQPPQIKLFMVHKDHNAVLKK